MIHVICLGNPMHGDDGFGAAVHRHLAPLTWPAGVAVLDWVALGGGIEPFRGCGQALVVDALPPGSGAPGEVLRLETYPEDVRAGGTAALLDNVRRLLCPAPAITILGAVAVRCVPFHSGLSPLVAAAAETVAAMVTRELGGRRAA